VVKKCGEKSKPLPSRQWLTEMRLKDVRWQYGESICIKPCNKAGNDLFHVAVYLGFKKYDWENSFRPEHLRDKKFSGEIQDKVQCKISATNKLKKIPTN
jgi:hypothetical protein